MKRASFTGCLLGALVGVACTECTPAPAVDSPEAPPSSHSTTHAAETERGAEPPEAGAYQQKPGASTPPPAPTLPADLILQEPHDLPWPGERDLRVSHAPAEREHALVYLHGMCGDSKGADVWSDLATARGTLVVVRANVPCGDRPGYKWPQDPELIEARIAQALEFVKGKRAGLLDTERVTLIGYSQGADRAELVAARYPDKYKKLVLGGPPSAAEPSRLRQAESVAVLGGELEDASHMRRGEAALRAAGIRSKFFLLPRAPHGNYGPEGHRVMDEVFNWLYEDAP